MRIHGRFSLLATAVLSLLVVPARGQEPSRFAAQRATLGRVERLDPRLDRLVPPDATMEVLAEGFNWSEGPVWSPAGGHLLFSDVPENTVYRWKEGAGISVFLKPSGDTSNVPRGGEPGSNGLLLDREGRLVLCQHGDRRVARLEAGDAGMFVSLADRYQGKRFNSPNDAAYRSNGDLYFTDPPYGLLGKNDDPKKELPYNGVYRLQPNGAVSLMTDQMTYPNGIAFSPDESTLYVANSDPEKALWMAYDLEEDGTLGPGRVFFDATSLRPGRKGLPDGLKVDRQGNLFATGPGGVLIFAPDGTHLGTLGTGEATGNCAWGDDGSTLYITADMSLARIRLTTRGAGWE